MMLLSYVRVDFWYMSARRGAFEVGYSGERDSGVKWEKTSLRPRLSLNYDNISIQTGDFIHFQLQNIAPICPQITSNVKLTLGKSFLFL
jgi:hypothetical protein